MFEKISGSDDRPKPTYKKVARFIETQDPVEGLEQEIDYISNLYGKFGQNWWVVEKYVNMHKEPDGYYIPVEVFKIILKSGERFQVAFDISSFFGADL